MTLIHLSEMLLSWGFFGYFQVNWVLHASLLPISFFFKQTQSPEKVENYNTGAKVLLWGSSEAERTTGTSPGKATKNSASLDSS